MELLGHKMQKKAITAPALVNARIHVGEKPFEILHARATEKHLEQHADMLLYKGYRLYSVDGSSLNLNSTKNLDQTFGRPSSTGSRSLPQASFTVLQLVNTGWICNYRLSPCKVGELVESKAITSHLGKGDLLLADRLYFCPKWYTDLCDRGVAFLFRLNSNRHKSLTEESRVKIANCRNDGAVDCLVTLRMKNGQGGYDLLENLRYLEITRTGAKTLYFITTLSHNEATTAEIAELYRDRWGIETEIGIFKGQDHLPVVRSKREDTVRQEVIVRIIAHNSIRFIQAQACSRQQSLANTPPPHKPASKPQTETTSSDQHAAPSAKWQPKNHLRRRALFPIDLQFKRTVECTLGYILSQLIDPSDDPRASWDGFLDRITQLKIMAKPGRSYPRRGRKYNKGKPNKGNVKAQRKRAAKRKTAGSGET